MWPKDCEGETSAAGMRSFGELWRWRNVGAEHSLCGIFGESVALKGSFLCDDSSSADGVLDAAGLVAVCFFWLSHAETSCTSPVDDEASISTLSGSAGGFFITGET